MSRKIASMLVGIVAAALLAAPAAAKTQYSGGQYSKWKIARAYVRQGPIAGPRFYVPASRSAVPANRGVGATNAFQHYDDIFVLDP